MSSIKTIAKQVLPTPVISFLRKIVSPRPQGEGHYKAILLSEKESEQGSYKKYLGGGAEEWQVRGAFQLFFLKTLGLRPESRFLDIGCGPLRAGIHFIDFLEARNYCGVDYNADFIHVANQVCEENDLATKAPAFYVVDNFDFSVVDRDFDFAIAFSVLNHCNSDQRATFFREVSAPMKNGGKIYITHANWFDESAISIGEVSATRRFQDASDVSEDLKMEEWGWGDNEGSIYPIVELTVTK